MTDLLVKSIQDAILPSIRQIVAEELRSEKLQQLQERYVTVDETQKISGNVSRATIYNWDRAGLLQSYLIGGRRLYKYSEVIEAIEKIKTQSAC